MSLGDLLAGPRPRRVSEVLAGAYAREGRLARQLRMHAEHLGRYPDKRAQLLELAARADGYACRLAGALEGLGAAVPAPAAHPQEGRTNWERLRIDLDDASAVVDAYMDDAYAVEAADPAIAALLLEIREERARDRRTLAWLVARCDRAALDRPDEVAGPAKDGEPPEVPEIPYTASFYQASPE